jgi:TolA-binding protein
LERKGSPPGGALGSGDSHGVGVPTSEGPRVGKTNGAPDARPERRIAGLAPSPAEVQFAKGWDAIRSGDRAAAARSFAAAAASDPGSAIAEDALYWEAATLGRLGRAAEARRLLEEFLARYTASPRTSEIRVMLAWNLMASGENVEAERLFRASLDDSSGFVRKSARAGVDALRARGTSSNP